MLAGLGDIGTRAAAARARAWGFLTPRPGRHYELWDCSWLLLVLGLVGYVLTKPVANTTQALSAAPLRFVTEMQLGVVITLAAVVGLVCAYLDGLALRIGYVVVIAACWIMAANFVLGFFTTGASVRVWISATIYGWIASRLIREGRE